MIAFEITINGEKACIAGFPEHHVLTASIISRGAESQEFISVNVQGNDLDSFNGSNFSEIKMKEWINDKFSQEVKIEIRIVDIESELISKGNNVILDMNVVDQALSQFSKTDG